MKKHVTQCHNLVQWCCFGILMGFVDRKKKYEISPDLNPHFDLNRRILFYGWRRSVCEETVGYRWGVSIHLVTSSTTLVISRSLLLS